MIEKIESIGQFEQWQTRDLFTVRILSLMEAYGLKYQFATFYRQVIDGKITAIMSKLDNDYTLSVTEDCDNEELVRFFCIYGYSSILSSDSFFIGADFEQGSIMTCDKKYEIETNIFTIDENPKLMDLYKFINYDNQDFKAWYVDISHRVRHNKAKAFTLNVDNSIVSSGILSSIIDNYAVLTAVQTKDTMQCMGYGTSLVKYICSTINGTIYIMRDENLNEKFYNNCGFKNVGKWRMYR